jgi:Uma2 family endonuclease
MECPVSTKKGIRGVDSAWISPLRRQEALRDNVLVIAPEICVEVLSPGSTRAEMDEKRSLLFEAGAVEVGFCDEKGLMFFFTKSAPSKAVGISTLCPDFPASVG